MSKKRKLKDIDIEEISIVDRPANRQKFFVVKNEEGEESNALNDLFDDLFGVNGAGDRLLEKIDNDQKTKFKNTLRRMAGEELITHLGLEYYEDE